MTRYGTKPRTIQQMLRENTLASVAIGNADPPYKRRRLRDMAAEPDDSALSGYDQHPCEGHYVSIIAAAQIKDAVELLAHGKKHHWQAEHLKRPIGFNWIPDYWGTVWWMFDERDPDCNRIYSLDWCCMVIEQFTGVDIDSSVVRATALRMGLQPTAGPRTPRTPTIHPLTDRRAAKGKKNSVKVEQDEKNTYGTFLRSMSNNNPTRRVSVGKREFLRLRSVCSDLVRGSKC